MATKKYRRNKLKSRRRGRKTRQRGGCINGQCMTGGTKLRASTPTPVTIQV